MKAVDRAPLNAEEAAPRFLPEQCGNSGAAMANQGVLRHSRRGRAPFFAAIKTMAGHAGRRYAAGFNWEGSDEMDDVRGEVRVFLSKRARRRRSSPGMAGRPREAGRALSVLSPRWTRVAFCVASFAK
jgi:hypothetical protein